MSAMSDVIPNAVSTPFQCGRRREFLVFIPVGGNLFSIRSQTTAKTLSRGWKAAQSPKNDFQKGGTISEAFECGVCSYIWPRQLPRRISAAEEKDFKS